MKFQATHMGILNFPKKSLQVMANMPEYTSLVEKQGCEIKVMCYPQPALSKKHIQAAISVDGFEGRIYLSCLKDLKEIA